MKRIGFKNRWGATEKRVFKTYTDMANYFDGHALPGVYYALPSHIKSLFSVKRVDFDGVFAEVEGRGQI